MNVYWNLPAGEAFCRCPAAVWYLPALRLCGDVAHVEDVVDLSQPVSEGDCSQGDFLVCGRCRPNAEDGQLFQPKALRSPKQPTLAERLLH